MIKLLKILTKDHLCGKSDPPINQSRRRPPIEVTAFQNHCDYFGDYLKKKNIAKIININCNYLGDYLKKYRYNHQDPCDYSGDYLKKYRYDHQHHCDYFGDYLKNIATIINIIVIIW